MMDNWRLIDFAPVIMALVASGLGLSLAKLLVYLHRRQASHPDIRRADITRPGLRRGR